MQAETYPKERYSVTQTEGKIQILPCQVVALYNGIKVKTSTYAAEHLPRYSADGNTSTSANQWHRSDYRIRLNGDLDMDIPKVLGHLRAPGLPSIPPGLPPIQPVLRHPGPQGQPLLHAQLRVDSLRAPKVGNHSQSTVKQTAQVWPHPLPHVNSSYPQGSRGNLCWTCYLESMNFADTSELLDDDCQVT